MTAHSCEFYIAHLFSLQMHFCNGTEDSEEADKLRDDMDDYWYNLTGKEIQKVEEFYLIIGREFPTLRERKLKEILA